MARPRVVRTKDGGEVTMKNLPAEVADKVKDLLENGAVAPSSAEERKPMDTSNCKNTALGTFQSDDGKWNVAVVKYDPASKTAVVEEVVVAGDTKPFAEEQFKILAVRNNLV